MTRCSQSEEAWLYQQNLMPWEYRPSRKWSLAKGSRCVKESIFKFERLILRTCQECGTQRGEFTNILTPKKKNWLTCLFRLCARSRRGWRCLFHGLLERFYFYAECQQSRFENDGERLETGNISTSHQQINSTQHSNLQLWTLVSVVLICCVTKNTCLSSLSHLFLL